jgi:protein TonB
MRLFRDELGSDARDAASGRWPMAVNCWSSCRLAALLALALALGCANPETCSDTRQATANDAAPTRAAAATPVGEAAATPTPATPTPVTPIPVGEYFEIPAGPASPTEPLIVAGDVVPPVAIHRPSPDFTALGHVRVAGIPIVSAVIAADGTVEQVRVVRSVHPDLDRAIVAAIEQWRFRPATLHGKPVAVHYSLTVHIRLR